MEEDIPVRYTFVLMLAIADPTGLVIGTDVAIARRLNMSVKLFKQCILVLESPDEGSNSKESEGRRIIKSEGERGYQIVNYVKYRDLKDEDERRQYMRDYMRKYRGCKHAVNSCKTELAELTHADAAAASDANESISIIDGANSIYLAYPKKVGKQAALKAIKAALKTETQEKLLERTQAYAAATETWVVADRKFIPHPSTWFNQGRYDDDPTTWQRNGTERPRLSQLGPDRNAGTFNAGKTHLYKDCGKVV